MYPGQTDSGLDPEGTTATSSPGLPSLSSPTRSGLRAQTPMGGAATGLMAEALPDGTHLLASEADAAMPWALRPKRGAAGHLTRREPQALAPEEWRRRTPQAKASFQAQAGSADSAGKALGGKAWLASACSALSPGAVGLSGQWSDPEFWFSNSGFQN